MEIHAGSTPAVESRMVSSIKNLWQNEITRLLVLLILGKILILLAIYIADGTLNFLHLMSTSWDSVHFQAIADQE